MTAPLLEAIDLRTSFKTPRGVVRAVDGVSFTLEAGRTLGIVGESGSGKSVLARSLMNLLFTRGVIRSGSVRYRGEEISSKGIRAMGKLWGPDLAMVFQDPMTSLNPTLTIGEQLKESLWWHLGLRRQGLRDTAVDLLRSVGIPEPERRIHDYPHQLSGGMRQRVTIAIALACSPSLLVADEPTTALDVTVQRQVLDLLQAQQRERGMGMILITHDLGVVAGRTDEIAVMYAGRIVEKAPTRSLFHMPLHPYTEGLLRSIPRLSDRPHVPLHVVPGQPPDLVEVGQGCPFAPRCSRAQPKCFVEEPLLTDAGDGHSYACFTPVTHVEVA